MAKYIEIADGLRERIRRGEYPVGTRIPSIAALQETYGVRGLNTVRSALRILISEGLLRSEQGVGTWVLAVPPERPKNLDVLAELRSAREALDRAISAIEEAS
jgi:DNA-binding GntR family transcriptional regulator